MITNAALCNNMNPSEVEGEKDKKNYLIVQLRLI